MKNDTYAPGPWIYYEEKPGSWSVGVKIGNGAVDVCNSISSSFTAKFISNAPDMYKALKTLEEKITDPFMLLFIKKVINKIEGTEE